MSPQPIHDTLGLDLLLEILDFLAVPLAYHERACDLPVLASCSLVCRSWSAPAQRLLFRRVILPHNIYRTPHLRATTRDMLPSFLAALDPQTDKGRWLAGCVVSLTLRHTGREKCTHAGPLAAVLLRTRNLRHLDVTTSSCDFAPDTLERLRVDGPGLTSLSVHHDFAPLAGDHTGVMHRLVNAFPALRILEITSNMQSVLRPFEPRPQLALVCVKFNAAIVRDVGPCLASLLRDREEGGDGGYAAGERLEVLYHKSKGGHPSVLDDVLEEHGAHLRSLSVKTLHNTVDDASSPSDTESTPNPLLHCTRLERLELGRFPDARTLAMVPDCISSLAIAGVPDDGIDHGLDALIDALALPGRFPRLKMVSWRLSQYTTARSAASPRLESVCRNRGIALMVGSAGDGYVQDHNEIEVEVRRRWLRV